MIDGIDLLITLICVAILVSLWVLVDRYIDWIKIDRERRRQRQLDLRQQHEQIEEKEYRESLRFIFGLYLANTHLKSMSAAVVRADQALKEFGKAFLKVKLH